MTTYLPFRTKYATISQGYLSFPLKGKIISFDRGKKEMYNKEPIQNYSFYTSPFTQVEGNYLPS